jgi:hypothetical protein
VQYKGANSLIKSLSLFQQIRVSYGDWETNWRLEDFYYIYIYFSGIKKNCYSRKLTPEIYLQEILLLAYDTKLLCRTSEIPVGKENTDIRSNNSGTHWAGWYSSITSGLWLEGTQFRSHLSYQVCVVLSVSRLQCWSNTICFLDTMFVEWTCAS